MSPRRLSITAGAGALVMIGSLLLPAAHAQESSIIVHGPQKTVAPLYYGGAADCDDYHEVPALSPEVTASDGEEVPLTGDRSFHYTAERGFGVGPQVEYKRDDMTKLRDLTALKVDVKSPDGAAVGVVAAMYETSPGVIWYGVAPLPPVPVGQWRTIDATDLALSWRKNTEPVSVTATIKQFVLDHGPGNNDERKARVGILFGCNGKDFYVDNLAIGIADDVKKYNFEGLRTRVDFSPEGGRNHVFTFLKPAYMTVTFKSPDATSAVLRQKLEHVTCKDGICLQPEIFTNTSRKMRIKAWPYAGWQEWVRFPGGNGYEPTPPVDVIEWKVRPYIAPTANLKHPKKGQTLIVGGKIAPCHQGRKVSFQRKTNGKWRTIKSTTATGCKPGDRSPFSTFKIPVKLTSGGTWVWRVTLKSKDGWAPGKSREFRQKVTVPHHPDPTPDPGSSYTPPQTTPDPPRPPGPHG